MREPIEIKKIPDLIWLVAPANIELPTGFPFPRVNGDMLEMARSLLASDQPVVVAVDADAVDKIKALASIRGAVLRHLEHTVGDYSAYWHLQTKSVPSITVKEIMETRTAEKDAAPPKLRREDIATYDQRLATLGDISADEADPD